jgi:hypothetical protein
MKANGMNDKREGMWMKSPTKSTNLLHHKSFHLEQFMPFSTAIELDSGALTLGCGNMAI